MTEIYFTKWNISLGKPSKKICFFWKVFPNVVGWGGWFPNKVQIPQTLQIAPKIAFFLPEFHLSFSKISHIWENFPQKTYFFGLLPWLSNWIGSKEIYFRKVNILNHFSSLSLSAIFHSETFFKIFLCPAIQDNHSLILFSPLGLPTSRAALHKHFRDLWWDFQMFTAGCILRIIKKCKPDDSPYPPPPPVEP